MAINSKLKILNIIAGAEFGGAESFFERLTMSFEMKKNIDQTVIIKENKTRYNLLKKNIENIKQIKLFNNLNIKINIGIDHNLYSHSTTITDANRKSLMEDFI